MKNILDFKNYDSWIHKFNNLYQKQDDYKIILNDFINNVDCNSLDDFVENISEEIKNFLTQNYTHIIFYHASATDNINSYLNNGILPSSVENRIDFARKLFNQEEYPEITDTLFDNSKNKYLKDKNYISLSEGKIYLVLDDNILKEKGSSHYACYGGEHLLCFTNHLGLRYKNILKDKLMPVIFKCKVPIELIEESLNDITKAITVRFFECMVYPKYKFSDANSVPRISFKIEPNCILGCEFPKDLDCD